MIAWRSLAILAAFAPCPCISSAQMQTVQASKVFTSRQLAGAVLDPTGAAIADAQIEVCRPNWRDCHFSTTTGPEGQFLVLSPPRQKMYYLKIESAGFDILEIKVRLRLSARTKLAVKMHIAT